jgi:hypothetical protein
MSREAMQKALEKCEWGFMEDAANILRQALAQFEQKPVAWVIHRTTSEGDAVDGVWTCDSDEDGAIPVYTAPPNFAWVGLTDYDHEDFANKTKLLPILAKTLAEFIENKLKEKNT